MVEAPEEKSLRFCTILNCASKREENTMVRFDGFEVQLVEAKTKTPFKEHYHNRDVFVEVEPGQEYFIAIEKVGAEIY